MLPDDALIECIPNISEGRNKVAIQAVARAVSAVEGVKLLHIDEGAGAHRTVFTFAGTPEPVFAAAKILYHTALPLIDMQQHCGGTHPRIGAVDVCPFVPIRGIDIGALAVRARTFAREIGEEFGLPVYCYEASAQSPERSSLAKIRSGEYEQLPLKLRMPEWQPDFGTNEFNARWGATIIGARNFLLAYNINLRTTEKQHAEAIAARIRESAGQKGSPDALPAVRAIGWYMEEYGMAQVSTNLLDYRITNMADVFRKVKTLASELGIETAGSELIGLVPREALLLASNSLLPNNKRTDNERIKNVIATIGLDALSPFDTDKRILENLLEE